MKGVIDRFEGEFAVVELEDGSITNICKKKIPHIAKEGDVLNIGQYIKIDFKETIKRKIKIKELVDDIWNH